MLKHAVLLLICLDMTATVSAADKPPAEAARTVSGGVSPGVGAEQLASVTLGLLAVIALIFMLAWLFRRYGNLAILNRSQIEILGGVSLGTREKAVLLEVEGEKILVGVTPQQITRLHVLKGDGSSNADGVDAEQEDSQTDAVEVTGMVDKTGDFARRLQQANATKSGDGS